MLIDNHNEIDFSELNRRIDQTRAQACLSQETPQTLSLSALLALQDEDFIDAAFLQILRRAADPEGRAHYLNLLRNGTNPKFILAALRYSEEGKSVPDALSGLRSTFWLQKLFKLPVLGTLLAVGLCMINAPRYRQTVAARFNAQHREKLKLQAQIHALQHNQQQLGIQLLRLENKFDALSQQPLATESTSAVK